MRGVYIAWICYPDVLDKKSFLLSTLYDHRCSLVSKATINVIKWVYVIPVALCISEYLCKYSTSQVDFFFSTRHRGPLISVHAGPCNISTVVVTVETRWTLFTRNTVDSLIKYTVTPPRLF